MELRQLRYYRAVVELLSFSAAARRLNVAQSAISRQVMSLEDELGTRLLDRSRSHVALTLSGEAFYHDVRQLLTELDVAIAHVQAVAGQRKSAKPANGVDIKSPRLVQSIRRQRPIQKWVPGAYNESA